MNCYLRFIILSNLQCALISMTVIMNCFRFQKWWGPHDWVQRSEWSTEPDCRCAWCSTEVHTFHCPWWWTDLDRVQRYCCSCNWCHNRCLNTYIGRRVVCLWLWQRWAYHWKLHPPFVWKWAWIFSFFKINANVGQLNIAFWRKLRF